MDKQNLFLSQTIVGFEHEEARVEWSGTIGVASTMIIVTGFVQGERWMVDIGCWVFEKKRG